MKNNEHTKIVKNKDNQSICIDINTIRINDFDNNKKIIKYRALMANNEKSDIPVDYQEPGIITDINTKLSIPDNPIDQYYNTRKLQSHKHNNNYLKKLLSNLVNDNPEKFFTKTGNWKRNLINDNFYKLDKMIRNYVLQIEILNIFQAHPNQIFSIQDLSIPLSFNAINQYINHATEDVHIASNLSRLVVNQRVTKIDINQYMLANANNNKIKLQKNLAKVIEMANELNVTKTLSILQQANTTLENEKDDKK